MARKARAIFRRARYVWGRKSREIAGLKAELAQKGAEGRAYSIEPENVVWIFATARSGTTWLSEMMEEMPGHARWNEPLVGAMLGNLYYERASHRAGKGDKSFILGERYKETWHEPVRALVLGGATARFPESPEYLVIKEPNGSIGAPLVMEALPESRMILMVRDPRDVVASSMAARKKGGWLYENRTKGESGGKGGKTPASLLEGKEKAYVKERARTYLRNIGNAKQAYDAHRGKKTLVRYEDLRSDTPGAMRRIYAELGIPADEETISRAVEKHSWENLPEEKKGEGKFYRKASPGGWREDLSGEQTAIVEGITRPLLDEFYPEK